MSAPQKDALVASLKIFANFAAFIVGLYALFRFLFHFGDLQAIGLALAIACTAEWASTRKAPGTSFTPHRLSIQFNLFPILTDLGLINGEEQWKALAGEAPPPYTWELRSVYHHSLSAWVINNTPQLVHYPALQIYKEQWKLEIPLAGLDKVTTDDFRYPWLPEVFVQSCIGSGHSGYHIGIRLKEDWWKAHKSTAKAVVLHEDIDWEIGTVRLTLAVLPWQITHPFYQAEDRAAIELADRREKEQVRLKAAVSKLGWKNEILGGEFSYFGETYEHKYALVWVQGIDELER